MCINTNKLIYFHSQISSQKVSREYSYQITKGEEMITIHLHEILDIYIYFMSNHSTTKHFNMEKYYLITKPIYHSERGGTDIRCMKF